LRDDGPDADARPEVGTDLATTPCGDARETAMPCLAVPPTSGSVSPSTATTDGGNEPRPGRTPDRSKEGEPLTHASGARQPAAQPNARDRLARQLQQLPNVGAATAEDLLRLGITGQDDLVGRDPAELYETLCQIDGVRHDPCLLDVLAAVVAYAEGGPPTPWWEFTPARKNREAAVRRGD
jgi:hypothetical protein